MNRGCLLPALGLVLGGVLAGCARQPGPPGGPAAPTVTVSLPISRTITDHGDYTGRTAAVGLVLLRARVSGYLQKIDFQDGVEVAEGAVLYEIDPRPYQDALTQAEAQITLQQAQLKYNQATYQRDLALYNKSDAVALATVQQDLSQVQVSEASVAAARASAATAKLNLEWTKVRAPISGQVSRTLVTPGNLVTADQTVLSTLVSQDPMYAYFDVDEPTVLRVQELIREGKMPSVEATAKKWPVYLGLSTEQGYPHEGRIDFSNNALTPSTATLQVRGVFANPKPSVGRRLLSPGLFVRIRVPISPPHDALLVTQDAISSDQTLQYVLVVDEQGKVIRHDVTLGSQEGGLQVVTSGLEANEQVVISGLQHTKPGMEVKSRLVPMPESQAGKAAASGGR